MFFAPRIDLEQSRGFFARVGSAVKSLVNLRTVLPDTELEEILPVTQPKLAREILENLSKKVKSFHLEEDLKIVSDRVCQSMELKPSWLPRLVSENPVINVYRFLIANLLLESIHKNGYEDVDDKIRHLKKIAGKIPTEVFSILFDSLKPNQEGLCAGRLLHKLFNNDPVLQAKFINFAVENFQRSDLETQRNLIYHLGLLERSPFEQIIKMNQGVDHSQVTTRSQVMAGLLCMKNYLQASFDDIKEYLSEKLACSENNLAQCKILVDLLKSSYHSKSTEKILDKLTRYASISINFQICGQLLNRQRDGLGFVSELIPQVLKGKEVSPGLRYIKVKKKKNLAARNPLRSIKKLKSKKDFEASLIKNAKSFSHR